MPQTLTRPDVETLVQAPLPFIRTPDMHYEAWALNDVPMQGSRNATNFVLLHTRLTLEARDPQDREFYMRKCQDAIRMVEASTNDLAKAKIEALNTLRFWEHDFTDYDN